ncbi:hypothetical protein DU475_06165 [Rhodopseudomonas sp. WA056]|uniref:hypothetical protein n=1 Tax=Rhodopseudomonas sp. WA056 TaxID=2269367 RepID=UPI0013E0B5B2|nr:hypothetical protein [Rhodopseudomonas sp. WA056]NEW86849.1 hypothetical protein [Rhodopseudomonas sp. WA056]
MQRLSSVLTRVRAETKSAKDPQTIFREFLAHLAGAHRKPAARRAAPKPPPRKRSAKRAK